MSYINSPVKYNRNKALGYNEIDTYAGHDTKTGGYYDIFGKTITEDDAKARRGLKSERLSKIAAEKQRILQAREAKAASIGKESA